MKVHSKVFNFNMYIYILTLPSDHVIYNSSLCIHVLLKALPPVCMKYTARDGSQVANIFAECYICHETLIKSCILSYTNKVVVF